MLEAGTGSLPAFEELVRRYEGRVFRFVSTRCRDEWDAREITQDVFVRAFRSLRTCDPDQFGPWIFTIARRKCIDHLRIRRPITIAIPPETPADGTPPDALEQREEEESLWQVAQRILSPAQFEALWLRYAEDMSVAQAARVMGKTSTHVKVLLFRARSILSKRLKRQRAQAPEPGGVPPLSNTRVALPQASAFPTSGEVSL